MLINIDRYIVERLSKTELSIIQYINEKEKELSDMSIVDIAFETFTSPATVSRAIRKCGINGFNELRYRLNLPKDNKELISINEIMKKTLIEANEVLQRISLKDVLDVVNEITGAFDKQIYIFGRGPTEQVVKEFSLRLQLLGYNVLATEDPTIMVKISQRSNNQLIILFSLKGETKELIEVAENCYLNKAKLIVISCASDSPLLQYASHYLLGYYHKKIAIKEFDVTSRIPLSMIARIIVDYLVEKNNEKT
ncbi:MurR/RpiR family transcriptional regulator [Pectinatus haikarae]|uniref:MurR/RpiR family transcriptional regulator n=1 Tax=Pectinatus haikarae TaxID=349096 RepID=UPI0018C5A1C3|nr:MurR/RpiR family transcriptional regulator [Pectinatus haikarae]